MKLFHMISLLVTLILTGCNSSDQKMENKGNATKKTSCLRINFQEGDPSSLHPHLGVDLRARAVEIALYEGLVRIGLDGTVIPTGAETIHISPSQTTYTFHLRPMRWSNGESVTSFHYENAWKQALSPKGNCARSDLFYPIKNAEKAKKGEVPLEDIGIKALDSKTLVVELENPSPYFLNLLFSPIFSPLYDDSLEPSIFNGPFLISSWKRKESLELTANPYYWDQEHVQLQKIQISLVEDPQTALALYEKDELDWIGDPFSLLPIDSIPPLFRSGKVQTKDVAKIYWIHCNTENFPLHSTNIRKALSYAINRKALVEHIFYGQFSTHNPLPKALSLLPQDPLSLEGDIEKARAFFAQGSAELNLTTETFPTLVLSYSHLPGQKQLVQTLQQSWKDSLGIMIELKESDWTTFFSNLNQGNYQIGGCLRGAFFKDPLYHLSIFKQSDSATANPTKWSSPEYRNLLDQAVITTDTNKRTAILRQAEEMLLDAMPIIPVYSQTCQFLLKNHVKGVLIDDLERVDFKNIYLEK
jgi:oligopeptide transport system substrate-binding protein